MTRILIVDDAPTDVYQLKQILEDNGYHVVTAATAEEGIAVARADNPDLILMDVVMPGLNGFQATREITSNPSTANIPVILVSVKHEASDRAWGMRQGAADLISKPVDAGELIGKISEYLAA